MRDAIATNFNTLNKGQQGTLFLLVLEFFTFNLNQLNHIFEKTGMIRTDLTEEETAVYLRKVETFAQAKVRSKNLRELCHFFMPVTHLGYAR